MARDLFWEEYADTRLVETGAPIFFQRIVRAKVFGEMSDEGLVRRHVEDLLAQAAEADAQVHRKNAVAPFFRRHEF